MHNKRWITAMLMIPILIGLSACEQGISKVLSMKGTPVHVERSLDAGNVSRISIKTKSSNIQYKIGTSDQIKVRLKGTFDGSEGEQEQLLVTEVMNQDQLAIKVEPVKGKAYSNMSLSLEVEVPTKVYEELKIKASSGNITTGEIEAGQLSVEASSGNISVGGYVGKEYKVEASSGNIELGKMAGNGSVEASSGNVDVAISPFQESVRVHTSSGNATIRVQPDAVFRIVGDTKLDRADLKIPVTLEHKEDKRNFEASVNQATLESPVLDVTISSGKMILDKIK
ncbi:hypothetical protein PAALTS15_01110 [Paenibacillus alvei TS-15]|uniref:DUF4097 domain-containing protein n=1 Tax=Paenibacillus alvei TS-15 TaxID=1117108 RepID=S9U3R8_PAEAL|nr:DUF4097 family beta strand repeat-containing protein [Paenibacillus alvei]EPY09216.1 hypothetical protein PAALTS15_01110 [Paenibacillus alvei TS-15]